ncbi:MAG: HAMP domain-containing protein [Negativicutes bacterium]|nr:HAMP domain-containing protein [Negativicutes bacterium]
MNWLRNLSIYYKINGIIIGMLLLLSIIIGGITIQSTMNLLDQQIEKRGLEVATYTAALCSNDVLLEDRFALFDLINTTKNNTDDIRYIFITDSAGRPLAHTFADNFPEGLPLAFLPVVGTDAGNENRTIRYNSNEGPIREVVAAIGNGTIGFVHVGMSENNTQQLLHKKIQEFVITTLVICFLAAFAATYLAALIIRPLQRLAVAAEEIRHGNFAVQADARDKDEVGHLSRVFNAMVASLGEKDAENNRLLKELRAKDEMRTVLMNKLITVQEEERKRISRELHDETGQSLTSLLAYMKVLLTKLGDEGQKKLLLDARDVAVRVLGGLRKMAVELRPPVLDDLGILPAMEKYIRTFSERHSIEVAFSPPDHDVFLRNEISLALYRILQESLTNIVKHANASAVEVSLTTNEQSVTMVVCDNGTGIRPGALEAARKKKRLGIYGMKERAELLGGTLSFQSVSDGGTTIAVTLPLTGME